MPNTKTIENKRYGMSEEVGESRNDVEVIPREIKGLLSSSKPCKNRKETIDVLEKLVEGSLSARLSNSHGEGPMLVSDVPPSVQKSDEGVILGIDEAGRGPVLGPMTYAAVSLLVIGQVGALKSPHNIHLIDPFSRRLLLVNLSFIRLTGYQANPTQSPRHSTILSNYPPSQETRSFQKCSRIIILALYYVCFMHLVSFVQYQLYPYHPTVLITLIICKICHYYQPRPEISRNMLRAQPYNLNAMSHDAAIQMIHAVLDAGVKINTCYVDTVGIPDSYRRKLDQEFLGRNINFVVEKKADAKYAPCSGKFFCIVHSVSYNFIP